MRIRTLVPTAALVATSVAIAACGGGSSNQPQTATKNGNAELRRGGELFAQRCGGCHTLSAAGTEGSQANARSRARGSGVDLDQRTVTFDDALYAIRNGGFGGSRMPADIVTGRDATAVARFVARYSGSKAYKAPSPRNLDHPAVRGMRAVAAGSDAGTLPAPPPSHRHDRGFLRAAFDSAQAMWKQEFTDAGLHYQPAQLVFFDSQIHTPCGTQSAETGPFYCPAAHGVYLNTGFFDALARAYGINGPFAAGYVTAHEVAHHVQQLLGLHARVAAADAHDPAGANARSVRVELQADCYAGIWLHAVARAGELTDADVNDILTAAAVVGDDYQRNKAGVELAPESWTHGSSRQRVHWVSVGKRTGLPADCDTFSAG